MNYYILEVTLRTGKLVEKEYVVVRSFGAMNIGNALYGIKLYEYRVLEVVNEILDS